MASRVLDRGAAEPPAPESARSELRRGRSALSPELLERLERDADRVRAFEASEEGRAVQAWCDAHFDETLREIEAEEERARAARG